MILSYTCSVLSMVLSSVMAVAAWYASKGFISYSLMSMDAVRHISGVRVDGVPLILCFLPLPFKGVFRLQK